MHEGRLNIHRTRSKLQVIRSIEKQRFIKCRKDPMLCHLSPADRPLRLARAMYDITKERTHDLCQVSSWLSSSPLFLLVFYSSRYNRNTENPR